MVVIIVLLLSPQSLVSPVTLASAGPTCCDFPVRRHLDNKAADGQVQKRDASLSEEEHVHQQLHQVGLSNDWPKEEFANEAGCDGLQKRGRKEDPGKALLVTGVEDLHHFSESVLGLLLQALHKQSGPQVWNIWPKKRHWSHTLTRWTETGEE